MHQPESHLLFCPHRESISSTASSVSRYLMNDIPRGTPRAKLLNSLVAPSHWRSTGSHTSANSIDHVDVCCSIRVSDSRLDDELSVAIIEFSNTPEWLQRANEDPYGFPKKTVFGTLWRGVDIGSVVDENGQTEYSRAVSKGGLNILFAEMLAEFKDTDVNVQDRNGWTALHWACAGDHAEMVRLCLSVPECEIGLKDKDGLTAFDLSLRSGNRVITTSFYRDIFDIQETHPQQALLRVLTITSAPATLKPTFPGAAMFDPVEGGNTSLVKALIERGIDLTTTNEHGNTALHVAAAKAGGVGIAITLIEAGSDVNAIGKGGATPLHYAAYTGNNDMVRGLLAREANPDTRDGNGKTALDLAVENIHHETVGLLKGVDVGKAPPVTVSDNGYDDAVNLLRAVTEISEKMVPPALAAVEEQGVLPAWADIESRNEHGITALLQAVLDGDMGTVQVLLKLGARTDVRDEKSNTALHLAARDGHTEIVEMLLASGANIEATCAYTRTPLLLASMKGHTEIVQTLLLHGARVRAVGDFGWASLHYAAEYGHTETLKALLTGNAYIDAVDDSEESALHHAAKTRQRETVQELLVRGADTEFTNRRGETALLLAVGNGHTDIVKLLIDGGSHIEVVDASNRTSLHLAARNGDIEIIQMLLVAGAPVDAKDFSRETALHAATRNKSREAIRVLIAGGARFTAGYDGTALDIAKSAEDMETVEVLKAARAGRRTASRLANSVFHQLGFN